MSKPFNQIYPNQAITLCSRAQAEQLVKYDHHVVQVNGRSGVMLTYEWMPVVFHHAEQHPPAPAEIQSIVDTLTFQVRGQPR